MRFSGDRNYRADRGLGGCRYPSTGRCAAVLRPTNRLACGRCHVSPAGGGPRTAFGNAFAANGHKVPAKSKKPAKTSAGGAAPSSGSTTEPATSSPVVTGGGGYYSSIVNPRFGYMPEFGYSNGVFFRIYPHSD